MLRLYNKWITISRNLHRGYLIFVLEVGFKSKALQLKYKPTALAIHFCITVKYKIFKKSTYQQ